MARTRGAGSVQYAYGDGGQLVDKEGKPIDTLPTRQILHMDADAPVAPIDEAPRVEEPITRYIANSATVQKNIEAYELMRLIEIGIGPLAISLGPDEYRAMGADLRRHFRAVRGET